MQNASLRREYVSILHYVLGKNASQLHFGRVLVAFWSHFGHKPDQNANPTHSVIMAFTGLILMEVVPESVSLPVLHHQICNFCIKHGMSHIE